MLEEILQVITEAKSIDDVVLVSKDESAFGIGKKFNCIEIADDKESGVNNAVSLANEFLTKHDYDCSVVLPQDIPLISTHDLDNLITFYQNINNCGSEWQTAVLGCMNSDAANYNGFATVQVGDNFCITGISLETM